MAYFADLTPYTYSSGKSDALNVGWVAPDQPFPIGPAQDGLLDRLFWFVGATCVDPTPGFQPVIKFAEQTMILVVPEWKARMVTGLPGFEGAQPPPPFFGNQTYGRHGCFHCQEDFEFPAQQLACEYQGRTYVLGSQEIRVTGRDGTTYAAPDMIVHYVGSHDYAPPAAFVEAVLTHPMQPRVMLIEPLSGEPPPADAEPPPSLHSSVRFEWRKHSDLPPTEV